MKLLPRHLAEELSRFKPETVRLLQHLPRISLKQLVYGGLAIATLTLVVLAFRPAPIRVDVVQVRRGDLQVTVNAEGKTRVRDRFVITAPANGHLDRILLDAGDPVSRGTLVTRIDPLPLTAAVKEALGRLAEARAHRVGVETQRPKPEAIAQARTRIRKAEADQQQAIARVKQAEAALAQSKRDRQRAEQLVAAGAVPHKDLEATQLNETTRTRDLEALQLAVRSAAAEVEVSRSALAVLQKEQADPDYLIRVYDARIASVQAELSSLRQEADRTDIRSPVAGRVLRVLQKSAQFVTDGTPLLEIGDTSQLELVIDVLSTDAVRIKAGVPILVEQESGIQPIRAKVRLVEPAAFTKVSALGVEEQRVNVIGDFINPAAAFGDAYRVDVRIVIWQGNNILKAPLSSLFRCDQARWCTFIVDKHSTAHQRQITVGERSDLEVEIKTGLKAGDTVILHPTGQIQAGSRVSSR